MGIGRYLLAVVFVGTLATAACSPASGADRVVTLDPTGPSAAGRSAPAVGLLPGGDASSSVLRAAVVEAIEAARDRAAEIELQSAEERAQKRQTVSRSKTPEPAEEDPATKRPDAGCARQAMTAGRFDPACSEYQGYLDPGTVAGRGPTSGELQMQYACEQGLVPESDC